MYSMFHWPQGQLGLFTWGTDRVEFKNTSVRMEAGTAFVVMQFPIHTKRFMLMLSNP